MSVYGALNNVTTDDGYIDANTLSCPGSTSISLDVHNAAIYYQLGHGAAAAPVWAIELFLAPTFRGRDIACDAIRVRSAVAGVPAQVSVTAA